MTIPVLIGDGDGSDMVASVRRKNGERGIVAYTEELRDYDTLFTPAFNSTFGIEMAQDFSFGGTPVPIHNGIDNVYWTGSAIAGNKYTFNSTDQANSGTNSVKSDKAILGNVMQFDKGSDIDLSNYVALTMYAYVESGWTPGSVDSMAIYGWDTGTNTQVGTSILLEDYFNEAIFGTWHKITVPLGDMMLSAETIDSLRIEVAAKAGAGPVFYLDDMQVEETGAAETFRVEAPTGKKFYVDSISFSYIDALNTTLTDSSMYNLSYNKILNESALDNGIVFQRVSKGDVLFSANVKTIGDSIKGGATLKNVISDGTNTCVTLETIFGHPIIMDSRDEDYIDVILSDDLSGLVSFTAIYKGRTRVI